MIAYLNGHAIKKLDHHVVVGVQGVGYLVRVGNDLLSTIHINEDLSLFIHTQVKEDDISLYGFRKENELKFFKQLITVSGIGAKTAMTILDMPLELTQRAILEEDLAYLSSIPGLGKKTASRLVLELKGKLEMSLEAIVAAKAGSPLSLQEEALEALVGLGYDKPSIVRFINSSSESFESSEELVRAFLQNA